MILRRGGKCATCQKPTTEKKEFIVTVNLFDPGDNGIRGEVVKQINNWRAKPLYCNPHKVGQNV